MNDLNEELRKIAEGVCLDNVLPLDIDGVILAAIHEGIKLAIEREPSDAMLEASKPAFELVNAWCAEMQLVRGREATWPADDPPLLQAYRAMTAQLIKELGGQ